MSAAMERAHHDDVDAARARLADLVAEQRRTVGVAHAALLAPLILGLLALVLTGHVRAALLGFWLAAAVAAWVLPRLRPSAPVTPAALARALDARFPSLQDSSELLVGREGATGVLHRWQR
ncbi:MAG: hypothetical protein AAFU65_03485, partial [Pseudomonadota bacterium]